MNKIMNGKAPTYLEDLFRPKVTINQIELRDSINKLAVSLPKTDCYKQSIRDVSLFSGGGDHYFWGGGS